MRAPGAQGADHHLVQVETGRAQPAATRLLRERQADIPQSDHDKVQGHAPAPS